jgi:hypothetical protein
MRETEAMADGASVVVVGGGVMGGEWKAIEQPLPVR